MYNYHCYNNLFVEFKYISLDISVNTRFLPVNISCVGTEYIYSIISVRISNA
jgi:hypothetical protein